FKPSSPQGRFFKPSSPQGRFFKPSYESISPIRAQDFAPSGRHGGPPGFAAHIRVQRPDAAVNQAHLHAGGVSGRGPSRIALALSGLDLKLRPGTGWNGIAKIARDREPSVARFERLIHGRRQV